MLLKDEKRAVLSWTADMQPDFFRLFLASEGVPDIPVLAGINATMLAVAVAFAAWLDANADCAPDVLTAAAALTPARAEAAIMAAAGVRLASIIQKLQAAGPPYEAWLAAGVPMVNRKPLRQILKDAAHENDVRVAVVRGDRGLGRTHSWHLIEYVARTTGAAKLVKADLISPVLEKRTAKELFLLLVEELKVGRDPDRTPTSDGVTATTEGERFGAELARRINEASEDWPRPVWLVFDNMDREGVPEAVKRLVADLAQRRLNNDFTRCVIFVLAPDPIIDISDPNALSRTDALGEFQAWEIEATIKGVNALAEATTKLSDVDLSALSAEVCALTQTLKGRDLCDAVRKRLVDLRVKVGA